MPALDITHATCVALGQAAVLLMGQSGSGKSAMALELMSRGAVLVADDRTILTRQGQTLIASCPPAIRGQIEARGVGILAADHQDSAIVQLVVDLDSVEDARLPQQRHITLLGVSIPLLHTPRSVHFPAAILQTLRGGRIA